MIERVKISTYSPDTDANNPGILVDCDKVYPTSRGVAVLPSPIDAASSPCIKYDAAGTCWFSQPVTTFNAQWLDGTSSLFVITEKVTGPLSGSNVINGAIFKRNSLAAFDAIYYRNETGITTGSVTASIGPSGVADANIETFDTAYDHCFSIDQYGDYLFLATGDQPILISKAAGISGTDTTGVFVGVTGVAGSANFTPKYVARAGTFVFFANGGTGSDSAGLDMDETYWRCSANGVFSGANQADFNVDDGTLGNMSVSNNVRESPGPIVGMKSLGRNVIIYKQRSVYQLTFTGPPVVWSQSLLSQEAGAVCNNAVVDIGGRHVFMGIDDFYYTEGSGVSNLPNPVKDSILGPYGEIDKERLHGVQSHYDRSQNTAYWFYPSSNYASYQVPDLEGKPICDKWVAWNFLTNSWSRGTGWPTNNKSEDQVVSRQLYIDCPIRPSYTAGQAISYRDFGDKAVNPIDSVSTAVEIKWNDPFTVTKTYTDSSLVGSRATTTGLFLALATNYLNQSSTVARREFDIPDKTEPGIDVQEGAILNKTVFTSNPDPDDKSNGVPAQLRTGDFGDGISYKFVRGVRPVFTGKHSVSEVTCEVYVREDLDDDWRLSQTSISGAASLNSTAKYWISVRSNSRYHQFKFIFNGQAEMSGFDIDYDDMGLR